MLWLIVLILVILAIAGGLALSKFIFLLLLVAIVVALLARRAVAAMGASATTPAADATSSSSARSRSRGHRSGAQLHEDDVVKVVVPVVGQGVLDWLANDERAFSHAVEVADRRPRSFPAGRSTPGPGKQTSRLRSAMRSRRSRRTRSSWRSPGEDSDIEDAIARGSDSPAGARRIEGVPVRFVAVASTDDARSNRETRAAENEDLFRRLNERLHVLATVASSSVLAADTPERFLCECSQTGCSRVLELTPSEYRSVRETNRRFLVFPDASHTDPEPRDRRRAARGVLGRREERRGRRGGREPRRGKRQSPLALVKVSRQARARKTRIQLCRSQPPPATHEAASGFRQQPAVRVALARRVRRTRARLRDHRPPRPQAGDRERRQGNRPAGRDADARAAAVRQDDAGGARDRPRRAMRCGGSRGRRSGAGRRARIEGFDRIAALASGLVYAAFFVLALEIVLDADSGKTGNPKTTTAGVLGWPAGPLLVGLAGLVFLGVAGYQAYRGVTREFLHDSKTEEMRPEVKHWIARIGTVGHLARAVVFGLVGAFLIKAAVRVQRQGRGRARRRARQGAAPDVRSLPARSRRLRPDRVRALLDQRRPLPAHLRETLMAHDTPDRPSIDDHPGLHNDEAMDEGKMMTAEGSTGDARYG